MSKWHVKELSQLTGVSVRTLHHYDQIGLLKPSLRLENDYRLYGREDFLKLKKILALKYFGFKLKEIKSLVEEASEELDDFIRQKQYIARQISELKKAEKGLDKIISHLQKKKAGKENNQSKIQIDEDFSPEEPLKKIIG